MGLQIENEVRFVFRFYISLADGIAHFKYAFGH